MASAARSCPFCGSLDTTREADFSTSLMVSLYYCTRCRTTFEAIKWGDAPAELDLPDILSESETGRPAT